MHTEVLAVFVSMDPSPDNMFTVDDMFIVSMDPPSLYDIANGTFKKRYASCAVRTEDRDIPWMFRSNLVNEGKRLDCVEKTFRSHFRHFMHELLLEANKGVEWEADENEEVPPLLARSPTVFVSFMTVIDGRNSLSATFMKVKFNIC